MGRPQPQKKPPLVQSAAQPINNENLQVGDLIQRGTTPPTGELALVEFALSDSKRNLMCRAFSFDMGLTWVACSFHQSGLVCFLEGQPVPPAEPWYRLLVTGLGRDKKYAFVRPIFEE